VIRILLADDHRIVREGLRSLLERQPEVEVVAEADDGDRALELAGETRPDVILMDVAMPGLNGVEATRRLRESSPGSRVVALSMHSDRRFVMGMLRAGAAGYLLKDSAFEELADAIRAVAAGQTYLSPRIAEIVVRTAVRQGDEPKPGLLVALTRREREVLQLVAEGRSTKEIGGLLRVSVKTIETHRKRIMEKLHLRTVAELTKFAIREGLTSLD